MSPLIGSFTAALVPLIVLVDPVAAVPLFIGLTRGHTRDEALAVARRATIAGALVLIAAAIGGPALFEALHLNPAAFRAAGGGLLLLLSIDMLRNKQKSCACGPDELEHAGKDIAIVPLSVPILSGPGAIAAVIMLAGDAQGALGMLGLTLAIVLVFVITFVALRFAVVVKGLLGASGLALLERLMGLVLAALAVQLIVHGVQALLV
jgi:multiple antibiotic resistance protein